MRLVVDCTIGSLAPPIHARFSSSAHVLAVMGPTGAGKSTVADALAGIRSISSGRIEFDSELFDDGTNTFVPSHRRPIAAVRQQPGLFGHMTVLGNAAFGPRCSGMSKSDAEDRAQHWLEEVGVADLGNRRPAQLSGGQRQLVALARALAVQPELLILDEPLSGLDRRSRRDVSKVLNAQLRTRTAMTMVISHDFLEMRALADDVVVLGPDRHVVAQGPPSAVAATLLGSSIAADLGIVEP
jgi:molybdate transport system ATP-binding protein